MIHEETPIAPTETPTAAPSAPGRVEGYVALVRPRIMAMVLLAMAVSALATGPEPAPIGLLVHALVGTALVIAGAVALNQRYEGAADAKMARTARRPVPTGRISEREATRFGLAATVVGMVYLGMFTSLPLAGLAALSWLCYVAAYTPMKSRTVWQTPVGALAGAMPVLLGASAAGALTSAAAAWALFALLFFWQWPHAMAIAWLFRHEFAAAEVKVMPVVEASGQWTGALAVVGSAALLPSTVWAVAPESALAMTLAAAAGLAFTAVAIVFALRPTDRHARWLLIASLVYLPVVLVAVLLARLP